jgi:hypothetical protein
MKPILEGRLDDYSRGRDALYGLSALAVSYQNGQAIGGFKSGSEVL